MKYLSAKRISILLTVLSLVLWSYSINKAMFVIGKFGLVESFPFTFFISLGILTIASAILWTSKENHWKLLSLQLGFLLLSLFTAHLMVGGAQSLYAWSLSALGNPEYILRTGHINPANWQLWQHNWPGNDIFQAVVLRFTGATIQDFANFLPWLPIIWQLLLFFPVFIFLKYTVGQINPNYCWCGMWIYYLGSWPGIQNNGPQPWGTLFAFSILFIISTMVIWKHNIAPYGYRLSALLIFAAVTTGHFLSSLVAFSTAAGSFFSKRLKPYSLPITAGLFIVAWAIYGAAIYNSAKIPIAVSRLFDLLGAFQIGIVNPVAGNESHAAVSLVRIICSSIIIFISLLGVLIAFRTKRSKYLDSLVLSIAVSNGIIALIIGSNYSHELFNRFFVYLLPALVYFGVKLLYFRLTSILLALLLIVVLPLSFIAQYGNEAIDYISAGNVDGTRVFNKYAVQGAITGFGPIGSMQNAESYSIESYASLSIQDGKADLASSIWQKWDLSSVPHYIDIDNYNRSLMDFYFNRPELVNDLQQELDGTAHYNVIFDNSEMRVYMKENASGGE